MTGNTTRHGTLVQKVESASISTYAPDFRAVLEAMLDIIPRTTIPAFTDVAILPNGGVVLGHADQWYKVVGESNLTRVRLIELLLSLCDNIDVAPRERFYLLELVKAMEFDGRSLVAG